MDHSNNLKAFKFFIEKKELNSTFTIAELRAVTNWSESTIKTYYSKKWQHHIEKIGNTMKVIGFDNFTQDDFIALMTQNYLG